MNKKEEYFNKFQKEICADCWGACFHYKPQEIKNKYNTICYIEDTTKAVGVGVFLRTIGYNISNMHHPMAFYRMVELNHEIITTDFNVAFNSGFSLGKEITLQNRLDNISQTVMLKINELQEKWDGVTPLNENSSIVKGKTVYIEFANRKGLEAIKSWLDGVSKTFDDIDNNNIN